MIYVEYPYITSTARECFITEVCVYLQSNFVQLCECEDGFLHHVHAFILQQHVQIGDQSEKELVVPFTRKDVKKEKKIEKAEKYFRSQTFTKLSSHSPCFLYEANDKLSHFNRLVSLKGNHLLQERENRINQSFGLILC